MHNIQQQLKIYHIPHIPEITKLTNQTKQPIKLIRRNNQLN